MLSVYRVGKPISPSLLPKNPSAGGIHHGNFTNFVTLRTFDLAKAVPPDTFSILSSRIYFGTSLLMCYLCFICVKIRVVTSLFSLGLYHCIFSSKPCQEPAVANPRLNKLIYINFMNLFTITGLIIHHCQYFTITMRGHT